jgi:integrase
MLVLPGPLVDIMKAHRQAQLEERLRAGQLWEDHGLVFAGPTGRPLDPDRHTKAWNAMLAIASVRPARLHDARHTAATLLLVAGVGPRVVMDLMGWSSGSMVKRYQHVVDELKQVAAERMAATLWPTATTTATSKPERR